MGHKYTLFFAAKEGRENDLLWVLNEKRISPDLREGESQTTPLHLTCARGHAKCAEILLKAGKAIPIFNWVCVLFMKKVHQGSFNNENYDI